jgi:hypothetical protein
MTNEEAIKELKIIREDYWDEYEDPMPALDMAIKALEQQPCEDAISRKWLKTAIHNFYHGLKHTPTEEDIQAYIDVAPSEQPKYNTSEWCHDCKEYDHEKHCCPRYNKVIRNAVKEIKQAKVGHWIYDKSIENWKCSECKLIPKIIGYVGSADFMRKEFKFCNHCGAKMEEVEE